MSNPQTPDEIPAVDKPLIYLASPHSHKSDIVRHRRALHASMAFFRLVQAGNRVFCPIAMSHLGAEMGYMLGESEMSRYSHWQDLDEHMIKVCDLFAILQIEGWNISTGIDLEWGLARQLEKPVIFLPPELATIPKELMLSLHMLPSSD